MSVFKTPKTPEIREEVKREWNECDFIEVIGISTTTVDWVEKGG